MHRSVAAAWRNARRAVQLRSDCGRRQPQALRETECAKRQPVLTHQCDCIEPKLVTKANSQRAARTALLGFPWRAQSRRFVNNITG